jgi:hypothetical protein
MRGVLMPLSVRVQELRVVDATGLVRAWERRGAGRWSR